MLPKDPLEIENMIDMLFDEDSHKLIARILCQKGILSNATISEIEEELSKKYKKELKQIKRNLIEIVKRIETDIKNYSSEMQSNKIKDIEKTACSNKTNTYFIGEIPREYIITGSFNKATDIEIITDHPALFKKYQSVSISPFFGKLLFDKGLVIDSLAIRPGTDKIIDSTGRGLVDIKEGKISSILSPEKEIRVNPETIFRAIRLAGKTGFEIESSLMKAIRDLNGNIANMPKERVELEILSLGKRTKTRNLLSELKII